MSTALSDIQFGFTGPGQVRGVFGSLSYTYPQTLRVEGQFTVNRRILTDSGKTEDLGVVATIPFTFTPADFGIDPATMRPDASLTPFSAPGRNPATDQLTGRTWTAADAFEAMYSIKRARVDQVLAPPAPAPAPEQP